MQIRSGMIARHITSGTKGVIIDLGDENVPMVSINAHDCVALQSHAWGVESVGLAGELSIEPVLCTDIWNNDSPNLCASCACQEEETRDLTTEHKGVFV